MRATYLAASLGFCFLLAAACSGPQSREQALRAAEERARSEESRAAVARLRQENEQLKREGDRLQASLDRLLEASALPRGEPGGQARAAEPGPGIFLGEGLAQALRIRLGDRVGLLAPSQEIPGGELRARSRTFRVAGVLATGVDEIDAKLALVSLPVAQDFFEMGKSVTAILIKCQEPGEAGAVQKGIQAALGGYPYLTHTWYELNRALFPEGPDGPPSKLRSKVVAANGHITVLRLGTDFTDHAAVAEQIRQVPGVLGATPTTYHEVFVSSDNNYLGALVRGIDPATVDSVTAVSGMLEQGKLELLTLGPEDLAKALERMSGALP